MAHKVRTLLLKFFHNGVDDTFADQEGKRVKLRRTFVDQEGKSVNGALISPRVRGFGARKG